MEDIDNITEELKIIRQNLGLLAAEMLEIQKNLGRLIHIFNEKITDIYGEIDHLKNHVPESLSVPRQRIILRNWYGSASER